MPSATAIAEGRIRRATAARRPVLLTGVIQGGGPCHWALEDHLKEGCAAYATPDAARTFDDDLERERIVNVPIRRLREKVALEPSRPTLILTVPGMGYRLAG